MASNADFGAELERPQSIVSMTTATSINDFDDSLSNVTTPRGTPRSASPAQMDPSGPDAPPSYDESQASQLVDGRAGQYPDFSHTRMGDITVYRTDMPQHLFSPSQGSVDTMNSYGVNDYFTTRDGSDTTLGDQPRASALLYHTLGFTNAPIPHIDAENVSPLTRPVAIPQSVTGHPSDSTALQFARLYARILQTASINAAQFAAFIDGLNALCVATSFSPQDMPHLNNAAPSDVPHADIPRSEWLQAYLSLCNTRFFAPRGLQVQIATLGQLSQVAKLPDAGNLKTDLCRKVLQVHDSNDGRPATSTVEDAKAAAAILEPFVEPLTNLIPTVHRDSEAMNHIANGLADFNMNDKPSLRSLVSQHQQQASQSSISANLERNDVSRAPIEFWTAPVAGIPLSLGPILPGKLPPSSIRSSGRKPSWQEWSDDFSKRMEQWGMGYGKRWEEWGMNYGKAWQKWGMDVGRKSSSRRHAPCAAQTVFAANMCSAQSQAQASSSTVDIRKEERDWDDASSISSDSSSSSSDSDDTVVDDPEAIFAKKVAKIEDMAQRATAQGKRAPQAIEQDRVEAIRKAEDERTKRQHRVEYRLRRRELRHLSRAYKRERMHWKRALKRDIKQAKRQRLSHAELQAITAARLAQMAQMQHQWDLVRAEIEQMKLDQRQEWQQLRADLKAKRSARAAQFRFAGDAAHHGRAAGGQTPLAPESGASTQHGQHPHVYPHLHPHVQHPHHHHQHPAMPVHPLHFARGHYSHHGRPLGWHAGGPRGVRGGVGPWARWHSPHAHMQPSVWPAHVQAHLQSHQQDTGITGMTEAEARAADEMLWIVIQNLPAPVSA